MSQSTRQDSTVHHWFKNIENKRKSKLQSKYTHTQGDIYILVTETSILYIGKTVNPQARLQQHNRQIRQILEKIDPIDEQSSYAEISTFSYLNTLIRNEFIVFGFLIGRFHSSNKGIQSKFSRQQFAFFKNYNWDSQYKQLQQIIAQNNDRYPQYIMTFLSEFTRYIKRTLYNIFVTQWQYFKQISSVYDNYLILSYMQLMTQEQLKFVQIFNSPYCQQTQCENIVLEMLKTPANHINIQPLSQTVIKSERKLPETRDILNIKNQKIVKLIFRELIEQLNGPCRVIVEGELQMILGKHSQELQIRSYDKILGTLKNQLGIPKIKKMDNKRLQGNIKKTITQIQDRLQDFIST